MVDQDVMKEVQAVLASLNLQTIYPDDARIAALLYGTLKLAKAATNA